MAPGPVPAATAAPSSVVANPATVASAPQPGPRARAVSFRLAPKPKLPLFSSKAYGLNFSAQRSCAIVPRSQMTEVVGGPSNDAVAIDPKPEVPNGDSTGPSSKDAAASPMSEEAVSEFMNQVASLVKLVDSQDIVELQLKQGDYELVIRKKEALPQPPAPAPAVIAQHHAQAPVMQPQFVAPQPATPTASSPAGAGASLTPPSSPAATAKSAKSSLPPLKSPMAGTFYKSPGPGQPPFVKVGDKVSKGQVLCIIEAMKLMNEIEADQAGTIVEVLADDAKPVAIDQPLFVIEP